MYFLAKPVNPFDEPLIHQNTPFAFPCPLTNPIKDLRPSLIRGVWVLITELPRLTEVLRLPGTACPWVSHCDERVLSVQSGKQVQAIPGKTWDILSVSAIFWQYRTYTVRILHILAIFEIYCQFLLYSGSFYHILTVCSVFCHISGCSAVLRDIPAEKL